MKFSHFSILAGILALGACTHSAPPQSGSGSIVVTDFRGQEIRLEKPAEKLVCLIESALSGVYMLQEQSRIIGVPSAVYDDHLFGYYARLDPRILNKTLPAPGNWDFVSIEQIVGLNPDLVIIWSSQSDAIGRIEQFGIPVYAVMLHGFADIYKEVEDLGTLLDCSTKADSLLAFSKDKMRSIGGGNREESPKSVYFMWSQGITETSGRNSTLNELLEAAGVINACLLSDEHVSVSIEKIYDWDPDMIVMWYNEKLDPDDILDEPLLQGLRAVKEGEVYELPEVFACDFWTLKMMYPAQLISEWAYAEHPGAEKQREMLRKMYVQLYEKELLD